jgi:hypothetical protein
MISTPLSVLSDEPPKTKGNRNFWEDTIVKQRMPYASLKGNIS